MSSWTPHRIIKKPMRFNNIPVLGLTSQQQFIPTFHILIATVGKPCLLNILNSLKEELTENDAITIVFDGEGCLKQSTLSDSCLIGHKSKINIIEQSPNLGYWGHGIRNKYQGILEPRTTFILNADDDDVYIKDSFKKLRELCSNPDTLYIAKFLVKSKNLIVPSQTLKITQDDIGTPCGIIPYNLASKSSWEHRYGGDFNYYDNLQKHCQKIKFLDFIFYLVN
jgi:hypothetical protein